MANPEKFWMGHSQCMRRVLGAGAVVFSRGVRLFKVIFSNQRKLLTQVW